MEMDRSWKQFPGLVNTIYPLGIDISTRSRKICILHLTYFKLLGPTVHKA